MIIPSASFDKVDIREIGLKCLVKSQMVDSFGSGHLPNIRNFTFAERCIENVSNWGSKDFSKLF